MGDRRSEARGELVSTGRRTPSIVQYEWREPDQWQLHEMGYGPGFRTYILRRKVFDAKRNFLWSENTGDTVTCTKTYKDEIDPESVTVHVKGSHWTDVDRVWNGLLEGHNNDWGGKPETAGDLYAGERGKILQVFLGGLTNSNFSGNVRNVGYRSGLELPELSSGRRELQKQYSSTILQCVIAR